MSNFGPIWLQIWPPGGVSQNCQRAISEVTMIARVTKLLLCVYLLKLHYMCGRFLIWPTFQGHRGRSSIFTLGWHISLLLDWESCNLVWWCILALSMSKTNSSPIELQIWSLGGASQMKKYFWGDEDNKGHETFTVCVSNEVKSHYTFSPTFQCHRGQSQKIVLWPLSPWKCGQIQKAFYTLSVMLTL